MNDKKCQVRTVGNFVCGKKTIRNEKCIFHLENKTEIEAKIFEKEFWAEFEDMEKNNDIKEAHFDKFIFPISINFFSNPIKKSIYFKGAQFIGNVDFSGVEFHHGAYFAEAEFNGKMDFSEAKFNEEADFRKVQFAVGSGTYFAEAEFNGKADFSGAKFNDGADFFGAKFNNKADFFRAEFNDEADFAETKFDDEADFDEVQFGSGAHFSEAEFIGKASFSEAKFNKGAYFSQTQFNNETNFYMSIFKDEVRFIFTIFNNESFINFEYSKFHKPKEVMFHNIDLGNVSFINADISEVDFLNETWRKKNDRLVVLDEYRIMEFETITYNAVTQLYRRLRRNYENNYKFAEAGDFFIGEMEMRRLDVTPRFRNENVKKIELLLKRNFSPLGIYKHLCLYGESYYRPAICASIVIIFYPLIMHLLLNLSLPDNSLTYMRTSASSFFQMENKYVGERLIGILILGLLFIALKRKFERKR